MAFSSMLELVALDIAEKQTYSVEENESEGQEEEYRSSPAMAMSMLELLHMMSIFSNHHCHLHSMVQVN